MAENGARVEVLTEVEAKKLFNDPRPEDRSANVDRVAFRLWLRRMICVQNQTGEDIIIYVQGASDGKTVTAGEASVSALGVSAHVRLEYAVKEHGVQKDFIKADNRADKVFKVGGGGRGAYVSALLSSDPKQLYCYGRLVSFGSRLTVLPGSFVEPQDPAV